MSARPLATAVVYASRHGWQVDPLHDVAAGRCRLRNGLRPERGEAPTPARVARRERCRGHWGGQWIRRGRRAARGARWVTQECQVSA
jgi:hypothetical protein